MRPFAKVEPGEVGSVVLLTAAVFSLLLGYYLLKTAREPLILLQGGAEAKSYASAGQSLALLLIIPAYAALARRVGRLRLLVFVYAFFITNLLMFVVALSAGVKIGVAFYLWVGVFNNTAVAQLWSFANDVYTREQGERLFAILGIGSSVGAVVGAFVAKQLAALPVASMLFGAVLMLVVCVGLVALVERRERAALRERREREAGAREPAAQPEAEAPLFEGSTLSLLARDRFLLWVALLTFLLNCVNSNGEYILDRTLLSMLDGVAHDSHRAMREVAAFKADYFGWVNLVSVLLQLFAVSRLLGVLGVRRALFVLPLVACFSYGSVLFIPVLALIRLGKIAENSLDYSLQNTARQAVFLVGTRAEKYVGKTVIDSFIVRTGDVCSALLVLVASRLELPVRAFALVNLALIACWLLAVVGLGREHSRRAASLEASEAGSAS